MAAQREPMTAGEVLRRLEADPVWRARRDAKQAQQVEFERKLQLEQADLLSDLEKAGYKITNVWDLVSRGVAPYPEALPILVQHLTKSYSDRTREGIARALAVKPARPIAWDTMIALIRSQSLSEEVSDAVMVAISAMARPDDLSTLIELISDPSIGKSRIFLVPNLMRSKQATARQALLDHLDDPHLRVEIARRLRLQPK